jgi:hypothetical protein
VNSHRRRSWSVRDHRRVVLAALAGSLIAASSFTAAHADEPSPEEPREAFTISDERIVESSGLTLSTKHPNVFYTVNDSGDEARVFALDDEGTVIGVIRLAEVDAQDIEAVASGPDERIWVADIGDNDRVRETITLYRFREPDELGDVQQQWSRFPLVYPDGPHDAETLLIHPETGQPFIVTKHPDGGAIYAAPEEPVSGAVENELVRVADAPPRITDGAFLPDGSGVVLRDDDEVYLLDWPSAEVKRTIPLPPQRCDRTAELPCLGESLAVSEDGEYLYAGSEGANSVVNLVPLSGGAQAASPSPTATATPTRTPRAERADDARGENAAEAADSGGGLFGGLHPAVLVAVVVVAVGAGVLAFPRVLAFRRRSDADEEEPPVGRRRVADEDPEDEVGARPTWEGAPEWTHSAATPWQRETSQPQEGSWPEQSRWPHGSPEFPVPERAEYEHAGAWPDDRERHPQAWSEWRADQDGSDPRQVVGPHGAADDRWRAAESWRADDGWQTGDDRRARERWDADVSWPPAERWGADVDAHADAEGPARSGPEWSERAGQAAGDASRWSSRDGSSSAWSTEPVQSRGQEWSQEQEWSQGPGWSRGTEWSREPEGSGEAPWTRSGDSSGMAAPSSWESAQRPEWPSQRQPDATRRGRDWREAVEEDWETPRRSAGAAPAGWSAHSSTGEAWPREWGSAEEAWPNAGSREWHESGGDTRREWWDDQAQRARQAGHSRANVDWLEERLASRGSAQPTWERPGDSTGQWQRSDDVPHRGSWDARQSWEPPRQSADPSRRPFAGQQDEADFWSRPPIPTEPSWPGEEAMEPRRWSDGDSRWRPYRDDDLDR